jgi:hypothetical protein
MPPFEPRLPQQRPSGNSEFIKYPLDAAVFPSSLVVEVQEELVGKDCGQ